MFYCYVNSQLVCRDSLPELLRAIGRPPAINLAYLKNFLLYGLHHRQANDHQTLYQDVFHVPFGYELAPGGDIKPLLNLREGDFQQVNQRKALSQLDKHLKQSIKNCLQNSKGGVAVELSGGLDSSSVAALLRRQLPEGNIVAFTNGVPPDGEVEQHYPDQYRARFFDESSYSRAVSDKLRLDQVMISEQFHFDDIIDRYTKVLGTFSEVLFPVLNYRCYELARACGVDTLFSGFGGDEMVTQYGNLCFHEYKQQGEFWKYYYEAICSGRIQAKMKRFFSSQPKSRGRAETLSHLPFLKNLPEMVQKDIAYDSAQSFSKALVMGDLSVHLSRRVTTSKAIAESYGINYQFPLLDLDLVQYVFHLPSSLKHRHGKGRYLMRQLMKGRLPKCVVQRRDKAGATAPAALHALQQQLPVLFLDRVTPRYQGLLADYLDMPKLFAHIESADMLDTGILRLMLMVLMFDRLVARVCC